MTYGRIIGLTLMTVALVAVWFMLAPVALAAEQSGAMTGPPVEIKKEKPGQESTSKSTEAMPGELGKGAEQPMKVPDSETFQIDLKNLKGPDLSDFENARESDTQSAISF